MGVGLKQWLENCLGLADPAALLYSSGMRDPRVRGRAWLSPFQNVAGQRYSRMNGSVSVGAWFRGARAWAGNGCKAIVVCLALLFIPCAALPTPSFAIQKTTSPLIASAASLRFALEDIREHYEKTTGRHVRTLYGATRTLATQISNGAPFELFLSADEASIKKLKAGGYARDAGQTVVIGRLALATPSISPLRFDHGLDDILPALTNGQIRNFAIANPETAPYGTAAVDALRKAGIWEALQPVLVIGENAGQAAQFVASGAAEAGLIPNALCQTDSVEGKIRSVLVDNTWHRPLHQVVVALQLASDSALQFMHFLHGPDARTIFARHGFSLPAQRP